MKKMLYTKRKKKVHRNRNINHIEDEVSEAEKIIELFKKLKNGRSKEHCVL